MAEENIHKKTGAERQAEVLVAALERANKNGGTLLNAGQKAMPQFYDKTLRITPVNALSMAMHSDNGEFKTTTIIGASFLFPKLSIRAKTLRTLRRENLSAKRRTKTSCMLAMQ